MDPEESDMDLHHIPVLLDEVLGYLEPKPGGAYADGTLGGGGHSEEILKRILPGGVLIGIDRDPNAILASSERLKDYGDHFIAVHGNYADVKTILMDLDIDGLDGMLMDLGVSSHQLDEEERGFSYQGDALLDMRMDTTQSFCAYDVVNGYNKDELSKVIWEYGEERWASRIADFIIRNRPVKTTGQLVEIIKAAIPAAARRGGPHPARRTFQAIRIEVNQELELLEGAIRDAVDVLKPQGRLCIITFHSLEDRIVKNTFRELQNPCTCPKEVPLCICGRKPLVTVITRKPVMPDDRELKDNPRSRSAKLRVCARL
jgi:16S rRNA (cytosine1402-N4)-methyltransferase